MESCTNNLQNKSFKMSDSKITMIQNTNLTNYHECPPTPLAPDGGHWQVINHLPKILVNHCPKFAYWVFVTFLKTMGGLSHNVFWVFIEFMEATWKPYHNVGKHSKDSANPQVDSIFIQAATNLWGWISFDFRLSLQPCERCLQTIKPSYLQHDLLHINI